MTRPSIRTIDPAHALETALAEIDARWLAAKAITDHAAQIVDATIPAPVGPAISFYADPEGFIARARIGGQRKALFRQKCRELATAARIAKDASREAEMQERAA